MLKELFGCKLTDSVSTDVENAVGQQMITEHGTYRFVKNSDSAVDFVLGEVAFHKLSDGVNMHKNVYQALTANLGVMAGVVVATGGIAHSSFGFIQTFGMNASISVLGPTTGGTTIAAGDYLKGTNAQSYAIRDAATQPLYRRNIQVTSAIATTTTPAAALVAGLINCT